MPLPRPSRPAGRTLAALAVGAVLVLMLAGAGSGPVPAARAGAQIPAGVIGWLTTMARHTAAINRDPDPVWITAVLTTHAAALTSATPGDRIFSSTGTEVFLITMRGHFTADEVSVPPGAKAPTGRYLSLVIDARTFASLDFGLSPRPPPVPPSSLGPVTYLTGHGP